MYLESGVEILWTLDQFSLNANYCYFSRAIAKAAFLNPNDDYYIFKKPVASLIQFGSE